MTTGIIHEQSLEKQMEKQMGCMAGFLQLFDRHQLLAGKRLYSTKRLPPSPAVDSTSESEKSVGSPTYTRELHPLKHQQQPYTRSSPESVKHPTPETCSPAPELANPVETPVRKPLPFPVFEFKEGLRSSWKFKESPRLSLDSRAIVDGKGSLYPREIRTNAAIFAATQFESSAETASPEDNDKQRRSPSVIARLMGLEALPNSGREPLKKSDQPELRRSASESRVSRDLLQYRFIDGNNFHLKQQFQTSFGVNVTSNVIRDNAAPEDNKSNIRKPDSIDFCVREPKPEPSRPSSGGLSTSSWKTQQHRKSFFDTQDFFPEPKHTDSLYGEIEKRLKMRGIDEPAKDLETLKQILEALQLKGLLHSKKPAEQIRHRNFIYDRKFYAEESPIVVMKPSKSPVSINRSGRTATESPLSNFRSKPGVRRNLNLAGESLPPVRPRRDRPEIDRNMQSERRTRNSKSPDRNESNARSPSSLARRKQLSIDTERRANDSVEQQRRTSPINSPKVNPKKVGSDQATIRSPRNRRRTPEIFPKERIFSHAEDQSSTVSESSISTSSLADTERSKMEEYKEGRSLLERCDKLLHSIAEITATELQPSPVSVLDSSFYKDESSPSPVMKRCIDFKDQSGEIEDENWSPVVSPVRLKFEDKSDDSDFLYISEILRASDCLSEDCDVFFLLEKQYYGGNSSCDDTSALHRKLVFDTIAEILDRKRQLPPWKAFSGTNSVIGKPSLRQIWSEFRRIRERDAAEDLVEIICGVLRKDMAGDGINGWGDCPEEVSEMVLDIERMIFKDLVAETIRDLAVSAPKIRVPAPPPRRKLLF
ncbi:PREDICTED: protein LONGIFOLIA 1-like isoform X2 [Nelumbo nucifera]|uniref:Protein LONGIFOLIA 1-like isoform X2 n=1 Tax=Nelumbo nucifera TaxID=4432 RepID=A0A1U8QB64_NELNU|nr:PREDICTED: protein LONGIFOLIA 1-like isoform X2 [Nelumbo nucifera]